MKIHTLHAGWISVLTFGILLTCAFSIPVPTNDTVHKYTKSVVEKDNLLIVCHVTESPDIEVYWTKNESKSTFKQDGIKLEIVDIRRTSSGDYVCHALNTSYDGDVDGDVENRTVEVVTVDVLYPAEVSMMRFGPNVIKENETWTGGSRIDGNPAPDFKYYNTRTGQALTRGTSTLQSFEITSWPARCSDAGEYRVAARNRLNHGTWSFQASNLTVLCRPIPDPNSRTPYEHKSLLGRDVVLQLDYVGYPAPMITWHRNGRVLPQWQQHNVHNSTSFNITDVSVDDYGEYTVTLNNSIGSSQTTFHLLPDGAPQTPTDFHYYGVTHDTVRLRWKSGFDMGSQQYFIVWKKIREHVYSRISTRIYDTSSTHRIGKTFTHVQTNLASDTEYRLTVNAGNNNNNSGYAMPLAHFRTLKRPPHYGDDGPSTLAVALGPSLGGLGVLGVVAFIVYLIKYRHLRTSYKDITPKKK